MQHQLLPLCQTQIAFLHHADIIVHKADGTEGQGHAQPGEELHLHEQRFRYSHRVEHRYAGAYRHGNADDEHQAAHGRGSLLSLVPAGADLPNGLPEVEPMQKRDQKFPKQSRKAESQSRYRRE